MPIAPGCWGDGEGSVLLQKNLMNATMKTILVTVAALLALGAVTLFRNHKTKEYTDMATIHLTTQEFKEKVYNYEAHPTAFKYEGTLPAIVDFYASWCGPCRMLAPVLDQLAQEYEGKLLIYKVDVDQNADLSRAFGIRSIPTLLFIPAQGNPSLSPGAPSKAQLKKIIEDMIK